MILHHGRDGLLSRLSDPFWFQALGCVMGMDWHSSGITTSVMGALKRVIADRVGLDGEALVRTSRLTARVDNNAIADGFQIYLHTFVVTAEGQWAVIQQGMNEATRLARRYHWHSATVREFTADPHTAIVGAPAGTIQNLVDGRAGPAQTALLAIAREDGMARLDAFTRGIERRRSPHADVDATIAHERAISPSLGGRTVFDDRPADRRRPPAVPDQLPLFPK